MKTTRILYGSAVFLAAFLLFLVEPMAGKQLLPTFGGSAAVWLTCLVFFQTALLAGYAYAHWLARCSQQRWQMSLHMSLLALAAILAVVWALRSGHSSEPVSHPVGMIFRLLLVSIGLPFLLLASTSPLLQAWLARLERGRIPYRLFALSNLASLLALALYPTIVEPHLTLRTQRIAWGCGFACFAVLFAVLGWGAGKAPVEPIEIPIESKEKRVENAPPASLRSKCLWLLLPMVAAMQLSAVTSYLTANIAAIPLLWILPLAAYLITLIIAFEYASFVPRPVLTRLLAVMLAALAYMTANGDVWWPVGIGIAVFMLEMFLACLYCHVEAYRLRPKSSRELTLFYLLFAMGGAVGSFLIGIASPLLFSSNYDVAISFFATALAALLVVWRESWSERLLWFAGSAALLYVLVLLHTAYRRDTLFATRNFYASLRVKQTYDSKQQWTRTLSNGIILHGTQIFTPAMEKTPTTYYAEDSGVGLALRYCCGERPRNVGVVGLGAGTIAAYGRAGDRMRFYELNPAVQPIAQHLFTYLRDTPAQVSFAEGDARASLAREAPQHFDVLVVDAFSGDAIPLHLLTQEALQIYKNHLAPGGIVAFHISNRHVDLEPAIALLAHSAGMHARTVHSDANDQRGESSATWVLVTDNEAFLALPAVANYSREPEQRAGMRIWTDDYSSLFPLLRFMNRQ
ncbi:MAG TPA: fused MFS/spermidine synthase [Acidobacteriaceae bacterium]|nr:fused MFS/spermidine synthase [Acidobacteriaceae bacterium]